MAGVNGVGCAGSWVGRQQRRGQSQSGRVSRQQARLEKPTDLETGAQFQHAALATDGVTCRQQRGCACTAAVPAPPS